MTIQLPPNQSEAYHLLLNGSVVEASRKVYEVSMGTWFVSLGFLMFLGLVYLKTENPIAVMVTAIMGNFLLYDFFVPEATKIFYGVVVISTALVLFSFFVSSKTT